MEASDRARTAVESTRGVLLVHDGRVVPAYYSSCCGGLPASAVDAISNRSAHDIPALHPRINPEPCCEEAPVRIWEARFPLDEVQTALAGGLADPEFGAIASVVVSARNDAGRPRAYACTDINGRTHEVSARFFRTILSRLAADRADLASPLKSEAMEPSIMGAELVLDGRGFGHGVGLCQFGAAERGRAGEPWDELLLEYYPEATLLQGWN